MLAVESVCIEQVQLAAKPALLVHAASQGPAPYVIFLHSASSQKEVFLEEAKALAKKGIGSLLPEAPFVRPVWRTGRGVQHPEKDRELFDVTARELSQWLDLLLERRDVDSERVFFFGKNLGGGLGGYWLTRERRIRAAAFVGAIPALSLFYTESLHEVAVRARADTTPTQQERYRELLAPTDLVATLPTLKGVQLFLQFGAHDDWITGASVTELSNRLRRATRLEWTDDDHEMVAPESVERRARWLESLR